MLKWANRLAGKSSSLAARSSVPELSAVYLQLSSVLRGSLLVLGREQVPEDRPQGPFFPLPVAATLAGGPGPLLQPSPPRASPSLGTVLTGTTWELPPVALSSQRGEEQRTRPEDEDKTRLRSGLGGGVQHG